MLCSCIGFGRLSVYSEHSPFPILMQSSNKLIPAENDSSFLLAREKHQQNKEHSRKLNNYLTHFDKRHCH